MSILNAANIRQHVGDSAEEQLAQLQVFAEIDSTNSYLMQSTGPAPGKISVAATGNQVAGRGRHGKTWDAPPGSGVCLSVAYTFVAQPDNLPALTLALGLAAVETLADFGAAGLQLKWPNDLMIADRKLGGILTEVQQRSSSGVTVVAGIGINVDLDGHAVSGGAAGGQREAADLRGICAVLPSHDAVAAALIRGFLQAFTAFEATGFAPLAERWSAHDWLYDREVVIDTGRDQVSGTASGIAADGALWVNTRDAGRQRITSGSVLEAGKRGEHP